MTKRALKRSTHGAFDAAQFEDDAKVRRLPLARGWSPVAFEADREQGYLKTIKPKSPGQSRLIEAVDAKALVLALGPAGTGKTYLAIARLGLSPGARYVVIGDSDEKDGGGAKAMGFPFLKLASDADVTVVGRALGIWP